MIRKHVQALSPTRRSRVRTSIRPCAGSGSANGTLKNEERVARCIGKAAYCIDFRSKHVEDFRDIGVDASCKLGDPRPQRDVA